MRYSDYEQRKMDAEYSLRMDSELRKFRASQPCKNSGNVECRHDGGCLRCDADAGEVCREV